MSPRVAIVIVNWNKKDYVVNLLKSLEGIDYDNYEIIVVDNSSTDGSVDEIKEGFPYVRLIVNEKNLGGTGGFNTGMRYALENSDCKYIWLLDNDAEVEKYSLIELVKAMEKDIRVGIAGSLIINPEDKDIIVEAGAFIRWDTIGVSPLFKNSLFSKIDRTIIEADYVAVCSALISVDAIRRVGLMDEDYFIFWDDMDWGLRFKKKDYKVVCVLSSVVYHPPFSEKRSPIIDYYYGIRNSLVTYAKHAKGLKRIKVFLTYLRVVMKWLLFLGYYGRSDISRMGFYGLFDFIRGKLGSRSFTSKTICNKKKYCIDDGGFNSKKILILNTGNKDDIVKLLHLLRSFALDSGLTLFINNDRKDIFEKYIDNIIEIDTQAIHRTFYSIRVFYNLLKQNYELSISPRYPSPFSLAAKRSFIYVDESKSFLYIGGRIRNFIKLIFIITMGECLAFLTIPLVYFSSFRYSKRLK